MFEKRISLRYARALFDVAESEKIEETLLKDFETLSEYLSISKDLFRMMNSPIVQHHKKTKIYEEIFTGKLSEVMLRFIQLLSVNHREFLLNSIIYQFKKIYNQKHGLLPIEVTSARDLDDTIQKELIERVAKFTGKKILPEFKLDTTMLGGVVVRIDDWVFDASMKTQLETLRNKLISGTNLEIDLKNN